MAGHRELTASLWRLTGCDARTGANAEAVDSPRQPFPQPCADRRLRDGAAFKIAASRDGLSRRSSSFTGSDTSSSLSWAIASSNLGKPIAPWNTLGECVRPSRSTARKPPARQPAPDAATQFAMACRLMT